jgi:hypothetical protein
LPFSHGRAETARRACGRGYIGIILALMPFIVLAQRIFMRSIKRSQAAADGASWAPALNF